MQALMPFYAQLPAPAQSAVQWAILFLLIALIALLLDLTVRLFRLLKASGELCTLLHWTTLMLAAMDCEHDQLARTLELRFYRPDVYQCEAVRDINEWKVKKLLT